MNFYWSIFQLYFRLESFKNNLKFDTLDYEIRKINNNNNDIKGHYHYKFWKDTSIQ
jgi:hypothetical protein